MKVLFSGDILSNYNRDNHTRSGIYFVAYSLLNEFCNMEDVQVTIFCSPEKKDLLESFIKNRNLNIGIKSLKFLPHRKLKKWFFNKNVNRVEKGLRPLRGRRFLGKICETLDKLCASVEARHFQDYDAFFSPCEAAPYAVEYSGIPIYTIIHDLIPIVTGEFPVRKGYWLYEVLNQVSKEKHYFCISECTKKDFLNHCNEVNLDFVKVVYNGYVPKICTLKSEEIDAIVSDAGLSGNNYILILGTVVPHKNVERQIRAGVRFIKEEGLEDFRIAIVGSCGNTEDILDRAKIPAEDRKYVVFCGYVPDEHIVAYYRRAFCLSYTSLYEGFGLPPLEAMKEGCPVVTSNSSSLPEVVGDAAICIPPEDETAHVAAYTRLLEDKDLRAEVIERGRKRVDLFRWDNAASKMMDEMRNVRTK